MSNRMADELHLIADTNLFFECKPLSELPWEELDADSIVLLLTTPLLTEIDKHKKGSGRTRKRALKVFGIVRSLIKSKQSDHVVRKASPRVVLRRAPMIAPDPEFSGPLNYEKIDDNLVGITSTLTKSATGFDVAIITDDTNVASSADHIGLRVELIDESWRREPQQTDEARRFQQLEKELDAYRQQEPNIVCSVQGVDEGSDGVRRTTIEAIPLSQDEIDSALSALERKFPMETDFSVPPDEIHGADSIETLQRWTFVGPSDDAVKKYQNEDYPAWIEKCRKTLTTLHEGYPGGAADVVLTFEFENKGTRPAENAKIEFRCDGDIAILRPGKDDGEDNNLEEENGQLHDSWRRPSFPSPPSPPKFSRIVHQAPLILKPRLKTGLDLAALGKSALGSSSLMDLVKEQERLRSTLGFTDQLVKSLPSWAAQSQLAQFGNMFRTEQSAIEALGLPRRPDPIDIISHSPILPRIPEPHDAEAFYFRKWQSGVPVQKGIVTRDLWRHQEGKIDFEVHVLFTKDGPCNGRVVCEVHAGNLTRPVSISVAVRRDVEKRLFSDDVKQMIEGAGHS